MVCGITGFPTRVSDRALCWLPKRRNAENTFFKFFVFTLIPQLL